jgi:hypothetical protein
MHYQEIEDAKIAVNEMKEAMPFFKNEARKKQQIMRINAFIKLINAAEKLVKHDVNTMLIDALALHRLKYLYMHNRPEDGFIDNITFKELIAKEIAENIEQGREVIVDDVAKMLAIDTLIAHKGLTEDEKAQDLTKNEKLSFMLGEAQEHYKMELYGLCEVWNKKISAWIS